MCSQYLLKASPNIHIIPAQRKCLLFQKKIMNLELIFINIRNITCQNNEIKRLEHV